MQQLSVELCELYKASSDVAIFFKSSHEHDLHDKIGFVKPFNQ
jgi:hypothetical protein